MNVRTLCLAILFECDTTGYEIRKKSTTGEFSHFVEASYGSIYPALAKLVEDGLVTVREEQQDGKPAKKVYSITSTGRETFLDSLCGDLGEDVFRSPFVMFARYAHHLPRALVEQRLHERIAIMEERLRSFEAMSEKYDAPADQWILKLGLQTQQVALEYVRTHMNELIEMAQRDELRDAAE